MKPRLLIGGFLLFIFLVAAIYFLPKLKDMKIPWMPQKNTSLPSYNASGNDLKKMKQIQQEITSGRLTGSTEVKGLSTDNNGQVLQASNPPMYMQYLPLPGKANFSSNQFNGSASLNFPIKLPPGPGQYTPSVSLNYSSSTVDELMHGVDTKKMHYFIRQSGPLGLGWSVNAGEGSVSIDYHEHPENMCYWTYKLVFPGGSGEMFKVDANGNKISKCEWGHDIGDPEYYWKLKPEWIASREWRTDPEMFLKIEQGWASDFFPGDQDFQYTLTKYGEGYYQGYSCVPEGCCDTCPEKCTSCNPDPVDPKYAEIERFDVWKISAPDGSFYVFGNGKTPHFAQRNLATPENSGSYVFSRTASGYINITSWKMYLSNNIFNQRIKYKYTLPKDRNGTPIYFGWSPDDAGVFRSDLAEISYGSNQVKFLYNFARLDTGLVIENNGTYAALDEETGKSDNFVYLSPNGISSIETYSNGTLAKKYQLNYYDQWTAADTTENLGCTGFGGTNSADYKIKGFYTLNDGLQSYHLVLKNIQECNDAACSANASLPPYSFTYQNLPYDLYLYNGTRSCLDIKLNTITNNRNSIYIKTGDNGFGGKSVYEFEPKRVSDEISLPDGQKYLDNDYSGFSCSDYCSNSACTQDCRPFDVASRWETNHNLGLKRAKLTKIIVFDGMNNFSESRLSYNNNVPQTVLKKVLSHDDDNQRDSDFVGYAQVTGFTGKKNLAVDTNNPQTWSGKTTSFYHQVLQGTGCLIKDPRAGQPYRNQSFDENGIISETTQYARFKNISDLGNNLPDTNGETCYDALQLTYPRPLVLQLRSDTVTAKTGSNQTTLLPQCYSTIPPGFCNTLTRGTSTYNWDFAVANNPERGNFAGLNKSENLIFTLNGTSLTSKLISISESMFISQGYGITNANSYFLNKPYESWINNPDNASDTKKYKWQKIYYDNLGLGSLSPNGKNLVTKTETLLDSGIVVNRTENLAFDQWGNLTQTKDGNGNVSSTAFDPIYHAYPISATNAQNQTTKTTYDYRLGVPLTITDINNQTTRSDYDLLGRLTRVYKPTDTTIASLEMEYHFNETATYGTPIAVQTQTRTEKDSADENKILKSFDFYDGLGNKVQSQSVVNGKAITSFADQHNDSLTMLGMKTFTTESFVSDQSFGKFNKNFPPGTKTSYSYSDLKGQNWKNVDINNNVSYTFANPETRSGKSIAPNGVYSLSFVDPVQRITKATTCKDTGTTSEPDILAQRDQTSCPSANQITSQTVTDFLGNTTQTIDNNNTVLTANIHDSVGRLKQSDDKDLGKSYVESYDLNGNVLRTKNAANIVYETSYDNLNRPLENKVNGATKVKYYYDQTADGKDCGISPKGKLCKLESWDNFGNIIRKYSKYDALGRVVENRTNYGGILSTYFGSADLVTNLAYDNADRQVSIKYPEFNDFTTLGITPETVTQTYAGPYLKTVSGDQTYISDLVFDDLGRLTKRALGNSLNEEYIYNGERRLDNIKVPGALDLKFTYNNQTGNIANITDNLNYVTLPAPFNNLALSKTMNYEYDPLSRLIRAYNGPVTIPEIPLENNTYTYDDLNNLTNKNEGGKTYNFAVDANFPYHGVKKINDGENVTYDSLGRMTNYTVPGEYKMEMKEFDLGSGKPQKIVYTNLVDNTVNTEVYYYDADGSRIMKALLGSNGSYSGVVLYAGSLLEKDTAQGIYRKNYFADGKLVATRVFTYASPIPTPIPSPVASTNPSPFNLTDIKTALTNIFSENNQYYPDAKINIFDIGFIINRLIQTSPSPITSPVTTPIPSPASSPQPSTTASPQSSATQTPCPSATSYQDSDSDGFGNPNKPSSFCTGGIVPVGYVLNADDCNDTNVDVFPGTRCANGTWSTCTGSDCSGTQTRSYTFCPTSGAVCQTSNESQGCYIPAGSGCGAWSTCTGSGTISCTGTQTRPTCNGQGLCSGTSQTQSCFLASGTYCGCRCWDEAECGSSQAKQSFACNGAGACTTNGDWNCGGSCASCSL